jgi:predicted dehydrogenase
MNKIKMGLVGLNFGKRFAQENIIDSSGPGHNFFDITAVCSTDKDVNLCTAEEWKVRAYNILDDMLKDDHIQAVLLLTGPIGRADFISKIINSGKDVMTTKPFESDPEKAQAVLEEAMALGRTVHLNSPNPMPSNDILQIMNWQKEYNLGRPIAAHWQTWCTYREKADGKWYDDPMQCPVAPVYRLGIYCINDLLWLLKKPKKIQVAQSRIFTGRPTADNGIITIEFEDGSLASVFASFCVGGGQPYPDTLTVNYENGTVYRNAGPINSTYEARMELMTGTPEEPVIRNAVFGQQNRSGSYQWELFYKKCCGQKLEFEISPKQVAEGIRITQAMKEASVTGQAAKL